MSSETLDEARTEWNAALAELRTSISNARGDYSEARYLCGTVRIVAACASLIAAERADAEREAMVKWQEAHPDLVWVQRGEIAETVEEATRPYRMVLARLFKTDRTIHISGGPDEVGESDEFVAALEAARSLLTDSDIAEARGEGKD